MAGSPSSAVFQCRPQKSENTEAGLLGLYEFNLSGKKVLLFYLTLRELGSQLINILTHVGLTGLLATSPQMLEAGHFLYLKVCQKM